MSKRSRNARRRIAASDRKPQAITQAPAKSAALTSRLTMDMLLNQAARLGPSENLLSQNRYIADRLTQNFALMDNLYRSDWIVNKIINTVPEDMTKNWIKLTCQVDPDQDNELKRQERKTHVKAQVLEGLKWGRLYGGAAGVIVIDGQEDMLDQPLDLDMVVPDSFRGILITDRWNGVYPSGEIVTDMRDPDFGLPMYYTFGTDQTNTAQGVQVHHSRVLRFTGRALPYMERLSESYWGMSEVEHVYEELNKRNTVSANIAQLIFSAHLRILKMEDLGQLLAMGDEQSQRDLYATLHAQNMLMNSMSLQVLSKDDDFQTFDYSFSGLSDIYEQFMMDIAGATEIPATKLFGRAPAGMNATGESDLRNYYDTVRQNQEAILRPILEKLYPVICLSAWGAVPDDLDFEFNPIRDTSDEERASLIQQTASAINSVFQSGIISQQTALKELRQAGKSFGMWTNITDEDIENAADQPQGGEEEGGEEGAPGEEEEEAEGGGMEYLLQGLAGKAEESPEQATTKDATWRKEDHPQGEGGKFVPKGGGSSAESAPAQQESSKKRRTTKKSKGSGGVKVSKKEYAQLTSHIMQNATPEQRKSPVMTTEMGGYRYTLEKNDDYNILCITKKEKVNAGRNRSKGRKKK